MTRLAPVLLLLLAARCAPGAHLDRQALEGLLALPASDLPHALPEAPVLTGPILHMAPGEGGLLVVLARGVVKLDATGASLWRTPVPEGVQRWAIPRSGRWVAGHSTRVLEGLVRVTTDWILDGATGERRDLARDRHAMGARVTDRNLLAWEPLPFLPGGGDEEELTIAEASAPPHGAPSGPSLGYRRDRFSESFLLDESLLIFRTTVFQPSGRSWWSLHHYDPDTGQGTKICDGTPGLTPAELRSLRLYPGHAEPFRLRRAAGPVALDPVECRLAPAAEEAPPEMEADSPSTISEVYFLEPGGPGGGLSLVHPEGRQVLALRGRTLRQVVRLPQTAAVFAITESPKQSMLGDDLERTLYRIDLSEAASNLATYRELRGFQDRLNEALGLVESMDRLTLDGARAAHQRVDTLLAEVAPEPELAAQARKARARARVVFAGRLARAMRGREARSLLLDWEDADEALARLELERKAFPAELPATLEAVEAREELWQGSRELQVALARGRAQVGDLEPAMRWLERAAARVDHDQEMAALAVALGDRGLRGGRLDLAVDGYQLARRLKPSSLGALRKLVRALLEKGEPCSAATVLRGGRGLDQDRGPEGLTAQLVRSSLDCGDLGTARLVLDGLRIDHPLDPTYLDWDAELLVAEGRPELALPKLRALLRLSPRQPRLMERLEALEHEVAARAGR